LNNTCVTDCQKKNFKIELGQVFSTNRRVSPEKNCGGVIRGGQRCFKECCEEQYCHCVKACGDKETSCQLACMILRNCHEYTKSKFNCDNLNYSTGKISFEYGKCGAVLYQGDKNVFKNVLINKKNFVMIKVKYIHLMPLNLNVY